MSFFLSLITDIEAKLNSIPELADVHGSHTAKFSGFPAATFEPFGNVSEFIANTDNQRGYGYNIIIHQELTNIGRAEGIKLLAGAVDAVLTAFDEDFNLGNITDFNNPLQSTWDAYTGANGPVKYAILPLVCNKEITVVTP